MSDRPSAARLARATPFIYDVGPGRTSAPPVLSDEFRATRAARAIQRWGTG
ncbi:MAG: hypothetical protein P8Q48_22110 [Paracoccaceae bacterium]|nr:hypothetical protein [Paracoccaceae bacterium]MDG1372891.1 hypothetical protein [Paracoccaceae bacterium]